MKKKKEFLEKQIIITDKSEEYFNYLREDDRIYIAKKFSERKGFFKHILPASWILTIGFYLLIDFLILVIVSLATPNGNEKLNIILGLLTLLFFPIISLLFGFNKRIKYIKEKKKWKECTDSGKKKFNEVFKQFEEMQKEYIGI